MKVPTPAVAPTPNIAPHAAAASAITSDDATLSTTPNAFILSYLTRGSSRSRVRTIALLVVAICSSIYGLSGTVLATIQIKETYTKTWWTLLVLPPPYPRSGPYTPLPASRASLVVETAKTLVALPVTYIALGLVALAIAGLLVMPGIRRGVHSACLLAMVTVVPMGLFSLVASATCAGFPILHLGDPHSTSLLILLLIPAVLFALLAALIKDILSFLLWIARHPEAEPPPKPFI